MKALRPVAWMGVGVLLGWALSGAVHGTAKTNLQNELVLLRAGLAAAQQAQNESALEAQRWKAQAEPARWGADELLRLRAEVSRLRLEGSPPHNAQLRPAGPAAETPSPAPPGAEEGVRQVIIPFERAPAAVGAAITQQMGGGQVRGVLATTEDGRTFYGVKGELPDGRSIAMQVAEDGSLLERSLEIATSNVPAHIQTPVTQAFGQVFISGAREIMDGGKTLYALAAKSPEARMEITVRADGTILGYSAKLRVPEK